MQIGMLQMTIKTMEMQKASLEALRTQRSAAGSPARRGIVLKLYYASGSPYAWRVATRARAQGAAVRAHRAVVRQGRPEEARASRAQSARQDSGAGRRRLRALRIGARSSNTSTKRIRRRAPAFPGDRAQRAIQRRVILETNDYFEKAPIRSSAGVSVKPEERDTR
jgi:hypothetical protein